MYALSRLLSRRPSRWSDESLTTGRHMFASHWLTTITTEEPETRQLVAGAASSGRCQASTVVDPGQVTVDESDGQWTTSIWVYSGTRRSVVRVRTLSQIYSQYSHSPYISVPIKLHTPHTVSYRCEIGVDLAIPLQFSNLPFLTTWKRRSFRKLSHGRRSYSEK